MHPSKPGAAHLSLHESFAGTVFDLGLEQMVLEATRPGNVLDTNPRD